MNLPMRRGLCTACSGISKLAGRLYRKTWHHDLGDHSGLDTGSGVCLAALAAWGFHGF